MAVPRLRVVIDTNVVFEGLTKQGGAAGLIIEAWMTGLLDVRVSDALAYEYADVLSRLLSEKRWQTVRPVLGLLLARTTFVNMYYSWRPTSPDPADDHVIDCAMNSSAMVVTFNEKDFRLAKMSLGLQVIAPVELVIRLAD